MIVYVSGPYSAPDEAGRIANVERALAAGRELLAKNHAPIIPHLSHYFDLWAERSEGARLPWEVYIRWDLELLRGAEGFLYLAPSPGADIELAAARVLGLPIFNSVDAIDPGDG